MKSKAWVVAVDMGYGHQRTAYPLRDIAVHKKIIRVNNYAGIPHKDRRVWKTTRFLYEFISRFRTTPIVGEKLFEIMDSFQKILGYYPRRDMSSPTVSLKNIYGFIDKGWGQDIIERLSKTNVPLVTTFFTPAFMAEQFNYPNDIYCIICDADIARTWAPLHPKKSRIKYCVPNDWARDRLKSYGVKPENIFLTGYPLPKENIGGERMEILKKDLGYRILNLDPKGKYRKIYGPLLQGYLGKVPTIPNHPLTIMFSIGGAGAQKEIVAEMVNSLREPIKQREIRVIISVGVREELRKYFEEHLKGIHLNGWVHILSGLSMSEYFDKFNLALRTTDILWTKPSELSFYAGLGIPILMAPPLGSQEDFNKRWLDHIGGGFEHGNPKYVNEWLFDLLASGDLAEMAMQGFIEMKVLGTYNIEKVIAGEKHTHV